MHSFQHCSAHVANIDLTDILVKVAGLATNEHLHSTPPQLCYKLMSASHRRVFQLDPVTAELEVGT